MRPVDAVGIREEASAARALDHRGVVLVGGQDALRGVVVGVADHAEQAFGLRLAVDDPVGVEDLVAAVLGVRLREHHQFDVARIAVEVLEVLDQVVDLVVRQRQAPVVVGLFQRGAAAVEHVHHAQRLGLGAAEQDHRIVQGRDHGLGHAIVQHDLDRFALAGGQQLAVTGLQRVDDAALDAMDAGQAAVVGDVGRLRGPRRNGAGAGDDDQSFGPLHGVERLDVAGTVIQHGFQLAAFRIVQRGFQVDEVDKLGGEGGDARLIAAKIGEKLVETGLGERRTARQDEHAMNPLRMRKSHFIPA